MNLKYTQFYLFRAFVILYDDSEKKSFYDEKFAVFTSVFSMR